MRTHKQWVIRTALHALGRKTTTSLLHMNKWSPLRRRYLCTGMPDECDSLYRLMMLMHIHIHRHTHIHTDLQAWLSHGPGLRRVRPPQRWRPGPGWCRSPRSPGSGWWWSRCPGRCGSATRSWAGTDPWCSTRGSLSPTTEGSDFKLNPW